MFITSTPLKRVDSPEVIRDNSRFTLSFKEVRDALFKFLMQSEIPFSGAERLPVSIQFSYKEEGSKHKNSFELTNHVNYKVACKLKGLTVGGKPVYLIAVPFRFDELSKSEKGKIIALQGSYNIVVFDEYDWQKLGLDISEKQWLRPLNKKILKSWARILFSKISKLDGEVASDYSLNDLFSNIERNVDVTKATKDRSKIQKLTAMVIAREFELLGYKELTPIQEKVLHNLVALNPVSATWLEEILSTIVTTCLKKVDLRKKIYKSFFMQSNGVVNPINAGKFGKLVYDYIKTNKKSLDVEILDDGILRVQHKKTFQQSIICLAPTTSLRGTISVDMSKTKRTRQDLGFVFEIKFPAKKNTVDSVSVYSVLIPKTKKDVKYGRKDRLPIPTDLKNGCNLWSKIK